jgi:hypothetical protein
MVVGRELIGKQMGQFHTDFESDIIKGNTYDSAQRSSAPPRTQYNMSVFLLIQYVSIYTTS